MSIPQYTTLSADDRLELDVVFRAEAEAQITVKQQEVATAPRFLFTLPYLNHFVRVSSAQAREFCGKTLGSMIVFIELNPNESRTIGDSDVYAAMDHLVDGLNEQNDLCAEWVGADFIQIDDVEFCALPDGYAVSVTYSNDPIYELRGQIKRRSALGLGRQGQANRVAVHEF